MMVWLYVLVPFFFIVVIGLSLLTFSFRSQEEDSAAAAEPEVREKKPMVLFEPTAWTTEGKQVPVEELVTRLETELRRRYEAAERKCQYRQEPPQA